MATALQYQFFDFLFYIFKNFFLSIPFPQSLNSGRLYNQAESMSRHYKHPCLLIEFHPDKAFCLQNALEIEPEIRIGNITTKLSILVVHYVHSLFYYPN